MAVTNLNDLDEKSTAEDVQSYVDQVVKEVEADRKGESKSDAQITSEQAGTPQPGYSKNNETPAEVNSGSKTAEADSQGEETGDTTEGPEWLTDDVKAEAAAYGIEESEITDFANREELDRALRLFDKNALEAGRKALAESEGEGEGEGEGELPRNEKGQFAKKESSPADTPPAESSTVEGQYEITLDADVYGDEVVSEFTRMRDHYEAKISSIEANIGEVLQQFEAQQEIAEEQHFDNLVDSLGHTDLFGETGKETDKQLQHRQDLMVAVKAQQIGLRQLGRPTEITQSLVNRVSRMVFAEELGKKDLKQRTRKITRQSNGRQGGGVIRPQDPREDPRDEADRLYRELDGV